MIAVFEEVATPREPNYTKKPPSCKAVAKKPFILTGGRMTAKEFCEKQIAYWLNESRNASDNADLKAFEFAEQELANYREMLKRYAV